MSHKRRLSSEEIVQIVREYKAGVASEASLAQRSGVNESTVLGWIKTYEAEGAGAFLPHDRNRVYSAEQKIEAVRAYMTGEGSLREQPWMNEFRLSGSALPKARTTERWL